MRWYALLIPVAPNTSLGMEVIAPRGAAGPKLGRISDGIDEERVVLMVAIPPFLYPVR